MAKAESVDVVSKLIKQLDKLADKGILSASRKDMASLKKYEKTFSRMITGISEAYEHGFEKQAGELEEAQIKMTRQVSKYSSEINKCIKKLTSAQTEAEKQAASDRIKFLKQEMAEKLKVQNELLENEMRVNKKIIEDYKKQKGLRERAKESFVKLEFGKDLEGHLNTMTGALTDFSGATSLINGSIKGLASIFASKAAKSAFQHRQAGGEGIGNMASMFGGISKSLMVVGATVGSLFAIFKAFQAIESAGKKVNKELINQIGATDLMRDGTNDLVSEVDRLRGIITDPDFSLDLGLSPEEAQSLVAQVSKLGMTFRSFGGDGQKLKETLMIMRQASVALGIGSEEAAGHINKFRLELGLTENLQSRMQDEFKNIRDLARQSSFGTAEFFNKVKTLTDGLGKLNVRTGQAGKILLNLTKVLGPEAGEAFTKGLIGAFAKEGYIDRIKRLFTTRNKDVVKSLSHSAVSQAKEFGKNFLGDSFIKEAFGGQYTSGEQILADIQSGKLSREDLQGILGKLTSSDSRQAQGAGRELYKLIEASAYNQGTMGKVRALSQADAGATLATDTSRVLGFLGGMKGVMKPSLGGLKVLENLGYGMEQIEDYRKILTLKSAEFENLKGRKSLTLEEQEKFGVKKDASGRLISMKTGEAIEDLQSYLMANSDDLEDKFGSMKAPSLESLMKDNIVATQTTAEVINAHLGSIMQGLYDVVFGFYNAWFGDRQSKEDQASQAGAISQITTTLEQLKEQELERSKRRSEIAQELKGEKNLEKRQALIDEREALKKTGLEAKVQKMQAEESLSYLRSSKLHGGNAETMIGRAMQFSLGKLQAKGQDLVGTGRVSKEDLAHVKMDAAAQALGFDFMEELIEKVEEEGVNTIKAKELREGLKAQGIDSSVDIAGGTLTFNVDGERFNSNIERFIETYGKDFGEKQAGAYDFYYPNPTSTEARKGRQEDAKEAADAQAKNAKLQKANEEAAYQAQKRIEKEKFEAQLRSKLGGLEGFGSTTGDLSSLRTRLSGFKETEENKAKLAEAKELFEQAGHMGYVDALDAGVSKGGGLYIKKGAPTVRTHPQDNALFYKDGGPMDPRMSQGGAGTAVFNITINGGPDLEQRVMGVLEKGLKKNRVVVQPN